MKKMFQLYNKLFIYSILIIIFGCSSEKLLNSRKNFLIHKLSLVKSSEKLLNGRTNDVYYYKDINNKGKIIKFQKETVIPWKNMLGQNIKSEFENSLLAMKTGLATNLVYFDDIHKAIVFDSIDDSYNLKKEQILKGHNLKNFIDIIKYLHNSNISFKKNSYVIKELVKLIEFSKQFNSNNLLDNLDDYIPLINEIDLIFNKLNIKFVPSHNDTHINNFLFDSKGNIYLIDWEYGGNNDPAWDLAYLSTSLDLSEERDSYILNLYNSDDKLLKERFIVYKSLTELWKSIFGRFQIDQNLVIDDEDKINRLRQSNKRYERFKNSIKSISFIQSIDRLRQY